MKKMVFLIIGTALIAFCQAATGWADTVQHSFTGTISCLLA